MITPEIKDEILGQFISSGMRFTINLKMHCHNFNIPFDEFDAILRQFEKLNLLKAQRYIGGTAQLGLELEALSKELGPKYLEKASTLTSLISSATSIIKFFG